MKESIGTTWIFGMVLIFILIFSSFLVLMINYSKVFSQKNEVVSILEKYEGYSSTSRTIIDNYLTASSYKTTGVCPDGYYGATSLDGKSGDVNQSSSYYYCINRDGNKYEVILFYSFNLPVLGDFTKFNITGETNNIILSEDDDKYIA